MLKKAAYQIHIAGARSSAMQALLKKAIRRTLRQHAVRCAHLSIAVVDDRTMARLNRQHIGHRGATDVLTFDLRDQTFPLRKRGSRGVLDGEIVLSSQRATREARQRGHSIKAELALYAVHGVLHLLGYDDQSPRAAQRMHRLENQILTLMGMKAIAPSQR